jgi:hypothetical protein
MSMYLHLILCFQFLVCYCTDVHLAGLTLTLTRGQRIFRRMQHRRCTILVGQGDEETSV